MKKYHLLLLQPLFLWSCLETGSEILISHPLETAMNYETEKELTTIPAIEIQEQSYIRGNQFSAEQILRAYSNAYPDRISDVTYRKNDWAMKVYGHWYYWAEGKLLPEESLINSEDYNSHPFYSYPVILPEFQELPEEVKKRLDNMLEDRKTTPLQRHRGFLNSLWRIYDRDTSWARVKTTFFLGFKLQIHRDLLEDLANVEEEIQRRMLVDIELYNFVQSLNRIDGYNWRQIAETETLSVHSYGIAIDLILGNASNKEIYWLWTKNKGLIWYDLPYDKRFSPPLSFIRTFEKYGFIWGGKWLFFDTIHFEYRPEILLLNNYSKNPYSPVLTSP